ncbi:MAG: oligopeptide:H+ symporter, partial [Gammaproteobacteria bacterium]|nr:oligopeptide:H+ symporter [Gammaproteobacteria bacterium]
MKQAHLQQQPRALFILSATELWERFGFYLLQTLLIFYLVDHFYLRDACANGLIGEYATLVYFSPLIGGYLADRLLGYRRAITIGAALLGIGYAMISYGSFHSLLLGLSLVIAGNGFLKPNISSMLGGFYQTADHRRHAGYTIFYIGINIGVIVAGTTGGFLQAYLGWDKLFFCSTIGMSIALLTFYLGRKHFIKTKQRARSHNKS